MRKCILHKYFFFFLVSIFVSACSMESEKDKPIVNPLTIQSVNNNSTIVNYSLLNLSMRKIDSLTAELNLKFTRRNGLGL